MPLIQKPQEPPQKEQIRMRLEKNLLAEMQAYCNWAGLSLEHFLEQAALLVFDKDKDWREQKKQANMASESANNL
jgi:hypothetical protein